MARTTTNMAARAVLAIGWLLLISPANGADGPQWPDLSPEGRARAVAAPPLRYAPPPPVSAFTGEMGMRYWYSWGKAAKDLYDIDGSAMVSRLTYDGLRGHSGEIFGRLDHTSGFFVKGYGGIGALTNGTLNDEDFEPFITPYSSTLSKQRQGHIAYFTYRRRLQSRPRPPTSGSARSPAITISTRSSPPLAASRSRPARFAAAAVSQRHHGHLAEQSLAFGARRRRHGHADCPTGCRSMSTPPICPIVKLDGTDFHWLRIGTTPGDFVGGIPEDGRGHGYQLQAALSYAYSPNVKFSVGGRYWRMESHGHTHFENNVVGFDTAPQPVDWKTEHMGVFASASFKFGPYPTGTRF